MAKKKKVQDTSPLAMGRQQKGSAANKRVQKTGTNTKSQSSVSQKDRINQKSYGTTTPNVRRTTAPTSRSTASNNRAEQRQIQPTARRTSNAPTATSTNRTQTPATAREMTAQRKEESSRRIAAQNQKTYGNTEGKVQRVNLPKKTAEQKAEDRAMAQRVKSGIQTAEDERKIKERNEHNIEVAKNTGRAAKKGALDAVTGYGKTLADVDEMAKSNKNWSNVKAMKMGIAEDDTEGRAKIEEERKKSIKESKRFRNELAEKQDKRQKKFEELTKDATGFEKALYGAAESGTGMLVDASIGAVTGTGQVGSLASMALRTYGTSRGQAEKEGATANEDRLYSLLQAGKEVGTELMFPGAGLAKKAYGKAGIPLAEKAANRLIKGLSGRAADVTHAGLRLAGGMAEENIEEIAGWGLDPLIKEFTYGKNVRKREAQEVMNRISEDMRSKITDENDAASASAYLSSDTFLEDTKKDYMEEGLSEKEAEVVANKMRDFLTASLTGDTETMERLEDEISKDVAKAHNILEDYSGKELLETIASTSLLTGVTGLPGSVTSSMRGAALRDELGEKGIRALAKTAIDFEDETDSYKGQAARDRLDSGKELTSTQVYELAEATQKQIEKDSRRQEASVDNASKQIRSENLVSPYGVDARGEMVLDETTNKNYESSAKAAETTIKNFVNNSEEKESLTDTEIRDGSRAIAGFTTGVFTLDDANELNYSNTAVREAFKEETGIDLNQYVVKDKDGKVNIPKTNAATKDALFAMASDNLVESAREATANWMDNVKGEVVSQVTARMGAQGSLALQSALDDVDERNRSEYMMVANASDMLYQSALNLGTEWDNVKAEATKMFPNISENKLQAMYEAGLADRDMATDKYRGKSVRLGESLANLKDSDRANVTGQVFVDTEIPLKGTVVRAFTEVATNLGVDIHLVDNLPTDSGQQANGMYDKGTIYINANSSFEQNMGYIFMHEVTHHLKEYAPEEYAALERLVREKWFEYDDAQMQSEIAKKIDLYNRATDGKQKLTEEEALEEIIADAAHEFLNDPNFANEVAEDNPSLAKAVLESIRNALRMLRRILSTGSIDDETHMNSLFSQLDIFDEAERLWLTAYRTAVANKAALAIDNWQNEVNAQSDTRESFSLSDNKKSNSASAKFERGEKLTHKQFNSYYSAHKLNLRGQDNIQEQIDDIKANGFKSATSLSNVVPAGINDYVDPERPNYTEGLYGAREGDTVLLVPKNYLDQKNDRIISGFQPRDYEVVTAERDFQPYYELYSKAYDSVRFSLNEPVERVKDLIAIHNLPEWKLKSTLELGGFPMPSIAVTNQDWTDFGDISILFSSDTIDPKKNKDNRVYSADAWTPTVPQTEYESDHMVVSKVYNAVKDLIGDEPYYKYGISGELHYQSIEQGLRNGRGLDGYIERLLDKPFMQYAYLKSQGKDIEIPQKNVKEEKDWKEARVDKYIELLNTYGEDGLMDLIKMPMADLFERDDVKKYIDNNLVKRPDGKSRPGKFAQMLFQDYLVESVAYSMDPDKTIASKAVNDYSAANKTMENQIDRKSMKTWLENLFDGIIKDSGVYNGKDFFTPAGNSRTFKQLHYPATVEGIVRAMREQGEKNVSNHTSTKTLRADTAKSFKSLDEIRSSKDKLKKLTDDEVETIYKELDDSFYSIIQSIGEKSPREYDIFAADYIADVMGECAQNNYTKSEQIVKKFAEYDWIVSEEDADDILQLFDAIKNMPVNMFEAKPRRAVGFNEIKAAIVPDNTAPSIIGALEGYGVPVSTYESANTEDRIKKVNQAASENDLRFSISEKYDEPYMDAVNSGNMEEAQKLVEEAAKAAGFEARGFHGTDATFTQFDPAFIGGDNKLGIGFYFSKGPLKYEYANNINAFLKINNPITDSSHDISKEVWAKFAQWIGIDVETVNGINDLDKYIHASYAFTGNKGVFLDAFTKLTGKDGIDSDDRNSMVAFSRGNIKSADTVAYAEDGSVIPLSERFNPESNDIRYSLPTTDADGKVLSDGQMEYFKNSQARDEQGRLLRLYHGTQNGGFTIFDPSYGISSRALFFTNSLASAKGYSGTDAEFTPDMAGEEDIRVNYPVYLDMQNPLIVDAEGHAWVDIPFDGDYVSSNWLVEYAQSEGYDSVIIKNVIDRDSADTALTSQDDYIVFNSNQVKDVNNLNPTENPDIRFSITPEDEAKSKMAYEYAMDDSYEALEYYEQRLADLTDEAAENRPIKTFSEEKISEFYAGLRSTDSWVHTDPIDEEDAVRMANSKKDFFANLNAKWNDRWRTEGEVLDVKSVKKDVRNLVMGVMQNSDTNSKYKNDLVKKTLFDVRTAFQLMKQDRPEVASELLYYSAQRMIDNVQFYVDGTFDQYKELKHYLRTTKISLGEEYWSDVDYDAFRKRNYNRINLVKGNTNVDQVYQELEELFPEFFNEDEVTSVPDQLLQIEHVLDTVQPYKEAYSSEEAAELAFDIADDLYEIMVKGDEVRSLADTYKARYDAKTKAMKQRHAEAMLRVRKARDEKVQKANARLREYKEEQKATRDHRKHYQRIQKNYDWLVQRILDPTKDKNVPEEFRQSLAEMLQTLDMQTENSKKLEAKTGHVAYKTFRMRELKDKLNEMAIKKGDNGVTIFELDANVGYLMDSLVKKLDGQSVDAMDATTISEIDTVLAAIRGAMVRHNKIRIENKSQEISEIAGEITEDFLKQVEKRGKAKKYEGIRGGINAINTSELTPVYFFERLGKFNVMYNEVRYGGFDTYVRNEKHIIERMEEITKPYFNKGKIRKRRPKPGSELDKWRDSRSAQTFNLTNGSITLTTAQMMSLYCLSKREQAMKHMYSENGGIVATPIDAGTRQQKIKERLKGKVETNEKLIVNEADVQTIIAALTPEQINVADQLQQLMANDMADLGNEAHREMYGYNVFEEQDYFPIKVHGNEIATDINDIGDVIQKIKSFGPAKPLDPHADNLIEIDDIFSVTVEHCNGMNLYNAFLVPISDFMRVYNYKQRFDDGKEAITVKDALEAAHGKKALDYIVNFMKDINGIKPDNRGGLEGVLNKALGTAKKTAVFGNIRVALQQPTAIVRALAEIKGKHLMPFIKLRPEKGVMEEMWKYCPIAYWKSLGYYDAYMGRDLEDTVMNNWSMADAALSDIYGSLDNWTWSLIWRAVKSEQAEAHPEMDTKSEEFLQMCGRRASEVFDKTQVVDSTFHRSDAMRSNQIAIKSLTAFMSEPTLTLNVFRAGWQKAIDQWQDGDKVKAAATFNKTVSVIVMQAALVSLAQAMADAWRGKDPGDLFGGGDDDDKDKDSTYLERLMHNLVYNFFDNLHLENNVYIVKDAMPLFNFMMSKAGDYYGWNKTFRAIMGWDQEYLYSNGNLIYAGGENIVQGIAQIFKKLEKGDDYDKSWYDIIQKTASGVGTFVGVPAGTLMRDFKPILDKAFENAFAADGSDVNETEYTETVTDKVMKKLGYKRKDRDEKRREKAQKEYEKERKQIQESVMDLEGEEKAKKTWSKVTTYIKEAEGRSIKELIAEGEFSTIDKYRTMFEAAGNDSTYFDERILAETKKAFKKTISYEMSDDEMYAQQEQKAYLRMNGMTDAEISEVCYKSAVAKDVKVAMMLGDEELVMESVMPLVQAGITQEDFDKLWTNRNRIDLKKYNGRYKDKLKSTGNYVFPVDGIITSDFGHRASPGGIGSTNHKGIDIGAAQGTPVAAADGGVVVMAGWFGGYGKTVQVKHDDGTITQYSHLSWWDVNEGDTVAQGQEIGLVGSTGNSTGPHLHLGVIKNDRYVDPKTFFNTRDKSWASDA